MNKRRRYKVKRRRLDRKRVLARLSNLPWHTIVELLDDTPAWMHTR